MLFDEIVGLVLAVAALVYLGFAMLRPEKGSNQYYNVLTGVVMVFGRFLVAIPALALAGSLAGKQRVPEGVGTFTTYSPIFVALLLGVIVIVGALTFLPADALGPVVEHLQLLQGKTF